MNSPVFYLKKNPLYCCSPDSSECTGSHWNIARIVSSGHVLICNSRQVNNPPVVSTVRSCLAMHLISLSHSSVWAFITPFPNLRSCQLSFDSQIQPSLYFFPSWLSLKFPLSSLTRLVYLKSSHWHSLQMTISNEFLFLQVFTNLSNTNRLK